MSPTHHVTRHLHPQEGSLARLIYRQMISPQQRLYSDLAALQWAVDIASGLTHLHGLNPLIIHR